MANYTIARNGKERYVSLENDLVASMVPDLQAMLKTEVQEDAVEVVFDLGRASMLDSSGIGLLIATYNSIGRRQGKVRVVNASPDILKLLQSMRLADRLNVSKRATD